MRRVLGLTVLLLVMIAVVPIAVAAERWTNMTVVTVDGQTFANTAVQWVNDGEGLMITRSDGGRKKLAVAEIALILDSDGLDRLTEVMAARGLAGQQTYPSDKARLNKPDPWLFKWTFGVGGGYLSTVGGSFPNSSSQWFLESSIRRRIYTNNYLKMSGHNQDLAVQEFAASERNETAAHVVNWKEEQLFLSFGHYYETDWWYWEAGLGTILRTLEDSRYSDSHQNKYLKGALRLEVGRVFPVNGMIAVDVAVFATLKPGFRDTRGGLAADLGLRAELMAW